MLSNLLIKETFDEFNLDYEKLNQNPLKKQIFLQNQNQSLIENIDGENYIIQDNEIKYKIFEDISSISKSKDNFELILNIPLSNRIISINKIKLSNGLNKFVKDIYLNIDDKIIIIKEEIFGENKKILKFFDQEKKSNIINYLTNMNINLHIILEKEALNYIMQG